LKFIWFDKLTTLVLIDLD